MPKLTLHEPPSRRYQVIDGSQSAHCCFSYTVIDTHRPLKRFKGDDSFSSMCECFEKNAAHSICTALNRGHYGG